MSPSMAARMASEIAHRGSLLRMFTVTQVMYV